MRLKQCERARLPSGSKRRESRYLEGGECLQRGDPLN
jgi:hypothetical protein